MKYKDTFKCEKTVKLQSLWNVKDLQRKSIVDLFTELKKLNLLSLIGLLLVEQFIGGISILFYMKHFAQLSGKYLSEIYNKSKDYPNYIDEANHLMPKFFSFCPKITLNQLSISFLDFNSNRELQPSVFDSINFSESSNKFIKGFTKNLRNSTHNQSPVYFFPNLSENQAQRWPCYIISQIRQIIPSIKHDIS